MTQKPDAKVNRVRNVIVGSIVAIVAIVVGFGLFYSTDIAAPDTFVEGKHYTVLEGTRAVAGTPVTVREYFSYACIHCMNFDPQVEAWREDAPSDVEFERNPVAFSPTWGILAQTYYALANLGALDENHPRLFRAIHENNRQFLSPAMMADFLDGHGVTKDEFLRAYDSPAVRRAASDANRRAEEQKINGVPSLVVADRYVVNLTEVPRSQAFEVVEFLVAKVVKEG